jgi:SNF2 family DNA or RNA helicase
MLIVDYSAITNKFGIKINSFENFQENLNFLKSLYLSYEPSTKEWTFGLSRYDEILLWLEKNNVDGYTLTHEAKRAINNLTECDRKNNITYFRSAIFDKSILTKNTTLYKFQEEGINWLLKRSKSYLADDAGLGKTIQSICSFSQWYKENKIDAVFIVVRSGLAYNWKVEILQFSNQFTKDDIQIIDNDTKVKPFAKYKNKKIIIISNHLLGDSFASYRKDYKRGMKLSKVHWNSEYCNIKKEWDKKSICLIIDEAHELKSTKAIRTKAMMLYKDHFDYRILLSATPAINRFEDWWAGFTFVDNSILGMSENAFKIHISKKIGDKWGLYNIQEYDEEKILKIKSTMSKHVLKRLKKNIPEMKTKQIIKSIRLEMTPLQNDLYRSFMQYEVNRIEQEYDTVTLRFIFHKFPYLLQIVDNPNLLKGKIQSDEVLYHLNKWDFNNDPRITFLNGALEEYIGNSDEKVIVFDNHPLTLDSLALKYKKYKPLVLHGNIKDTLEERQLKIDKFNDKNSEHKVFFLSTLIGGAGLNLNKACKRIIFFTLPYDATLYRQAQDRTWRINSVEDSIVEIPLLDNTIDITRFNINTNRTLLNDSFLNQSLSRENLQNLLLGII